MPVEYNTAPELIIPDWPAPECVVAAVTTRKGGHSAPPYEHMNLGHHVGDSPAAVSENRLLLLKSIEGLTSLNWLEQVHGTCAVQVGSKDDGVTADAQWTKEPGEGCAILTADCLPVLFCSLSGDVVAAAHAGWRGLEAGVLENTLQKMQTPGESLLAWLGPAIGPDAFEVGEEVREAFIRSALPAFKPATDACFSASLVDADKYFANLYSLAKIRLQAAGVTQIYGGGDCTFNDEARYFSYRRNSVTGRMASIIGIRSN